MGIKGKLDTGFCFLKKHKKFASFLFFTCFYEVTIKTTPQLKLHVAHCNSPFGELRHFYVVWVGGVGRRDWELLPSAVLIILKWAFLFANNEEEKSVPNVHGVYLFCQTDNFTCVFVYWSCSCSLKWMFYCLRFGIGRFTTEEEIDYTAERCIKHVKRLREMR